MTKQSTFRRLLDYMWRYKWISLLALVFIFETTLVTTALPLLARSYIDQFVSREAASSGLYLLGIYYGLFLLRVLLTFLGSMPLHGWLIALSAISGRKLLRICSNYVWLTLTRLQQGLSFLA